MNKMDEYKNINFMNKWKYDIISEQLLPSIEGRDLSFMDLKKKDLRGVYAVGANFYCADMTGMSLGGMIIDDGKGNEYELIEKPCIDLYLEKYYETPKMPPAPASEIKILA